MRRDPTHARVYGENDLDHLVERGLVTRCAQRTRVFLAVHALERRVRVQHPTAAGAEDVPRQLEQSESRRMEKSANHTLLVEVAACREIQDIDAAKIAVRCLLYVLVDGSRNRGVGGLPQDREQGLCFAHGRRLRANSKVGSFAARFASSRRWHRPPSCPRGWRCTGRGRSAKRVSYEARAIARSRTSASMLRGSNPASRRTSSVCSPWRGASRVIANAGGVIENGGAYCCEPSGRRTIIPRAANCGSRIASSKVSTGLTQQSMSVKRSAHSSRVFIMKIDASSLRTHSPSSPRANCCDTSSGRSSASHSARQNLASSAPTATKPPSLVS